MDSMYVQRCRKRAEGIIGDSLHPAHSLLRHQRCTYNRRHSRADSIVPHRTRFFNSFFPATLLASCRFHWYLERIFRQSSLEQRLSEYSCSNWNGTERNGDQTRFKTS
ncbi:hypothetical protein EYF80_021871 [Liparis tanakae]|uniref:Uncharacterized protein n=1 Tax=Liparis tanakae TaxID=230148 RepID=A0A4Z2HST6_9TELE|nr:hypothetical protein EYF80_021871 [Liparis tanakae]